MRYKNSKEPDPGRQVLAVLAIVGLALVAFFIGSILKAPEKPTGQPAKSVAESGVKSSVRSDAKSAGTTGVTYDTTTGARNIVSAELGSQASPAAPKHNNPMQTPNHAILEAAAIPSLTHNLNLNCPRRVATGANKLDLATVPHMAQLKPMSETELFQKYGKPSVNTLIGSKQQSL